MSLPSASNDRLYLSALVACLTGGLFGYSVGFIGGILVLPSFLQHFGLDKLPAEALASVKATTVSVWLVGALFGVLLAMWVCTRWGRKPCLLFCALLYMIGAVMQMFGNMGIAMFDAGRLVNGLGVGAGTLVSPMYISEISTAATRGVLLSGYQTALQIAALAGFWAAFAAHSHFPDSASLQWQIPVASQLIPGLLLLLGSLAVSESPKFLATHQRIDEAVDALCWLRRQTEDSPEIADEVIELKATAWQSEPMGQNNFWREIREYSVRRRLGIGIGLMVAQNMVGLNALNYYAPTIFISAGFTSVSASLLLTGLFGFVKFLSALSFMFVFVDRWGNRVCLKFGSALCGISICILALCIRGMHPNIPQNFTELPIDAYHGIYGFTSVAMVYVFAFGFSISLGPLSWNICSEIFPAHIRTKCCAITTITQWIFQIVIAASTPLLVAKVGWVTYLIYSICCAATFFWVDSCVPETKGVPLGDAMDELFKAPGSYLRQAVFMDNVDEGLPLLLPRNKGERRESLGYAAV